MHFASVLLAEPLVSSGRLNEFTVFATFQVGYVALAIDRFVSHVAGEGAIVWLHLVQRLALTLYN